MRLKWPIFRQVCSLEPEKSQIPTSLVLSKKFENVALIFVEEDI